MTKKPAFWALFALLSMVSAAFSWRYFTRAFPLLSIDIRMDRQTALAAARGLAADRHLGPASYRDAASFSIDETVQTFVELEGGGKPAFEALVADRLFTPYRWRVRHFQELEKNEVTFSFAPDGTPSGFVERVREDAPGAALSADAARRIAENSAGHDWAVDLAAFQAVEQSEERRTGGRIDYTFAYERPQRAGDGRYRLRLVVSGDRLTELTYFLKVPDAFTRRYELMRSLNNAIGLGGSLAFLLVYGVGGIVVGLFFLGRQRWVLWRQPVYWGVAVALAQTVARINEWPLAWMQYDTALSTGSFIARQAAQGVAELVAYVALFSLSFMAAESLTRRAFPRHPQFWRIWGRAAGSPAVIGRTAAGFLLVPVFVAYDVVLYFVATKWLGWWTPSEALFNPDVLAAYQPWFSAIARSFQAGFWEESLFRAVPIAGAALIGDRLGNRRLWIVSAFVVQAVIFGAGHAPYPTQPAYARPVELVLPSIGFGLLYLVFGLLPGIVLHFAFDAFWFAMPLFATTAAGIRTQQIIVVAMIFVPLWVVLIRRIRARAVAGDPVILGRNVRLNEAWRPEPASAVDVPAAVVSTEVAVGTAPSVGRLVMAAGAVAAVVWMVAVTRLPIQKHHLRAGRAEVSRAARSALLPAHLGPGWRFVPSVIEGGGTGHRFVWNTAGSTTYASLLGTYLNLPGWAVFVRTFEGDVVERAESWTVVLDADGAIQRVTHELPESRAGPSLDEASARTLARRTVAERFGINDSSLRDVSAIPSKLPQRTDWTVIFADTSRTLSQGELRLSVRILGNEVGDVRRFVFVPEAWERTEQNAQTVASIIRNGGLLLAVVVLLAGAILAIISWTRRQFDIRMFLMFFAGFFVLNAARFVNGFPALMAALSTAQPLRLQLAVLIGSGVVSLILQALAIALVAGVVPIWCVGGRSRTGRAALIGVALGMIASAVATLGLLWSGEPLWPGVTAANSLEPFIASATSPIISVLTRTTLLLLLVGLVNRMTAGWTRRRLLVGASLVVVGGVLGTAASPLSVWTWLATALVAGVLLLAAYIIVLKRNSDVVPFALAAMATATALPEALGRPYPAALSGAIVGLALTWVVAYVWSRALAYR